MVGLPRLRRELKRRDFLRGSLTLLGLGLASGCPRQSSPLQSPKGERLDPHYQAGHRLREGPLPSTPHRVERCEGVILGAGIAGLSAGWRWTRAGFEDYKILELEQQAGGNSRALPYPPTPAPIGAHYLPLPNAEARAVRRLLGEMEILTEHGGNLRIDDRHLCHSRQERVFYGGKWYEGLLPSEALSESATQQIEGFTKHIQEWAKKRDKKGKKVFALPLQLSSQEPEYLALDRISFAQYIEQQGWEDPILLWYLNYACRDDFGGSIGNCSAWAGLHYFAARDGGGLGDSDEILVWPEGNNRLARFLLEQQSGQLQTGVLVLGVKNVQGGVEVDYLDVLRNERVRVKSKVALFCLPSFLRKFLTESEVETQDFVYPPWLTANLLLDRMPQDLEAPGHIAWDNVLFDSPSLGYVVATHQDLRTDPLRPTVWTWYRPFPEGSPQEIRKSLLKAQWSLWSETVLSELTRVHSDIRERCQRLDVTVLGHGMVRPSVGFVWGETLQGAREPLGRIFFGHGDLSGMSLFEESQFQGVRAAELALASLGLKSESFL